MLDRVEVSFGRQLELWLDYLGVSQDAFAKQAGMQATYVSAVRRGLHRKPSEKNQKRIFEALTRFHHKRVDRERFWKGPAEGVTSIGSSAMTGSSARTALKPVELGEALEVATFDGAEIPEDVRRGVLQFAKFLMEQQAARSTDNRPTVDRPAGSNRGTKK